MKILNCLFASILDLPFFIYGRFYKKQTPLKERQGSFVRIKAFSSQFKKEDCLHVFDQWKMVGNKWERSCQKCKHKQKG